MKVIFFREFPFFTKKKTSTYVRFSVRYDPSISYELFMYKLHLRTRVCILAYTYIGCFLSFMFLTIVLKLYFFIRLG